MENTVSHAGTTLSEELRLVELLIELSTQTRQAILDRSVEQLKQLGARYQNAIVRLEIIRQTQAKVLGSLAAEAESPRSTNLGELLAQIGAENELKLVAELSKSIEKLTLLNRENARLLEKQFTGVKAFQQVLDLVTGVEKVYDRGGELKRLERKAQIEESR